MKKLFLIIFILFLTLNFSLGFSQSATNFKLSVLGTRNFADIDYLQTNLKKSDLVNRLVMSLASPGFVEFKGTYRSSDKYLIEEIRALGQNRFEVDATNPNSQHLLITLKKIKN